MENKQLNEKESLELIARMIQNTQQKMKKGSGIPFLVWGYTAIVVSLLVWYFLSTTGNYRWHYLWFAIPAISYPLMLFFIRKQEKGIKTYVDKVIGYIWISFGIAALLTSFAAFFWNIPILFIMLLLMAIGTAITGLVIQFKPIIIAGFVGMLLAFACLVTPGVNQILVFAAVFLVMMIIPGHILNLKGKE